MKQSAASRLFNEFFRSEKTGGLLLIFCTLASILAANGPFGGAYVHFWHLPLDLSFSAITLDYSIQHWVNDGLMTIFFLLVGLEIERELYSGELSSVKNAALPAIAALGGMIVPAAIHFLMNHGTVTQRGIGIPMATDIAFSLGVLSLLGRAVPVSLKIFLTAFAIIDDLGAIIIIALFYSGDISARYLLIALSIFLFLLLLNRLKCRMLAPYLLLGVIIWYCMLKSGVHATITGVLLAFAIPFSKDDDNPSFRLQHMLHWPVAYGILPLFAIANTALLIDRSGLASLSSANSLGIMLGLVFGKPAGILLFSMAGVALKICRFPADMNWKHLLGAGMLGGIGFTMSIFITNLAFADISVVRDSILSIIAASILSGVVGVLYLKISTK
jgi:NhaA family Na+:H+ antiporter